MFMPVVLNIAEYAESTLGEPMFSEGAVGMYALIDIEDIEFTEYVQFIIYQ
jgi:hypothetical protein